MKTYRFRGHSRTDPAKYRPEGELERWRARDPITLLGARLAAAGQLDESTERAMREEVQLRVDDAARHAQNGELPTLEEARSYVYAA
jgi:pyruvate dehydrogenase E1 component alpha subunit